MRPGGPGRRIAAAGAADGAGRSRSLTAPPSSSPALRTAQTSLGKRTSKTHTTCRRCGNRSYHIQKGVCSSCGYGKSAKMRRFGWSEKAMRRRTQGTGRMRYMKSLPRRAKNGFREGTTASKAN